MSWEPTIQAHSPSHQQRLKLHTLIAFKVLLGTHSPFDVVMHFTVNLTAMSGDTDYYTLVANIKTVLFKEQVTLSACG